MRLNEQFGLTKEGQEMITGIPGIWNQVSAAHAATTARASGNQSSGTSTSGAADSASISANDFLTLLVTEMQNQDPTAATDPNEYINQLVQVNSLEQLISINQTLTADSAESASGTTSPNPGISHPAAMHQSNNITNSSAASSLPTTIPREAGNLAVPAADPAALQVARSLAGQPKAH
jgi:flagellar basal-body rod modification protein FlgD